MKALAADISVWSQSIYVQGQTWVANVSYTMGNELVATGDKAPAVGDQIANAVESAKNQAQQNLQGGNTADPGGFDPNKGQKPAIDFQMQDLNRMKHILQEKHAWDRIVQLTGDV